MAIIESITFRQLYDQLYNSICSVCVNVNRLDIPTQMKSGYVADIESAAHWRLRCSLTNPIYQQSSATVQSQLQDFLNYCGIWSVIDNYITTRSYIKFLNCVSHFCKNHIAIATSLLVGTRSVIYISSNTTYDLSETILDDFVSKNLISDMQSLLINIIISSAGSYISRYSYTFYKVPI